MRKVHAQPQGKARSVIACEWVFHLKKVISVCKAEATFPGKFLAVGTTMYC